MNITLYYAPYTCALFEGFAIADRLLVGREWYFTHFTSVDAYFFLVL